MGFSWTASHAPVRRSTEYLMQVQAAELTLHSRQRFLGKLPSLVDDLFLSSKRQMLRAFFSFLQSRRGVPRPARTQHSVISEQSVIGYSVLLLSCPFIILCAWCPLRHPARDWLCLPHAPLGGGDVGASEICSQAPEAHHSVCCPNPPPLDARHHQAYVYHKQWPHGGCSWVRRPVMATTDDQIQRAPLSAFFFLSFLPNPY